MKEQKYHIFYHDGLKDGVSLEQASRDLATLLNITPEKTAAMIRATHRIIKTGLTRKQAEQYFSALDRIGMKVEIQAEQEATAGPVLEPASSSAKNQPEADEPASSAVPKKESTLPVEDTDQETYRDFQVQFNGRGFEYFKIWIVNIFLIIITLGIYSAWAKVRNKRYFYGNTQIDNSSFQYTASPITILKGRLIAVAIFVLFSVVSEFFPLAGLLLALLILAILPWVVVRSLVFNARNSMYRNVRFNFTGSVWDAVKAFLLWPLLIFITLGLATPLIWFKQSRFFVTNSAYGTTAFDFRAKISNYFRIFFMGIGGLILAVIAFGVLAAMLFPDSQNDPAAIMAIGPVFSLLLMLVYLGLFGYFSAALGNLYMNSTTLDHHGFSSTLTAQMMAWLYVSNTLAIVLSLGLMIPWAKVRMARYRASRLKFHAAGSLDRYISAEQKQVSALGDQMGEVFDMEFSVI